MLNNYNEGLLKLEQFLKENLITQDEFNIFKEELSLTSKRTNYFKTFLILIIVSTLSVYVYCKIQHQQIWVAVNSANVFNSKDTYNEANGTVKDINEMKVELLGETAEKMRDKLGSPDFEGRLTIINDHPVTYAVYLNKGLIDWGCIRNVTVIYTNGEIAKIETSDLVIYDDNTTLRIAPNGVFGTGEFFNNTTKMGEYK